MRLRFLVPWRRFGIDTILRPEQAQASLTRVLARERIWKLAASATAFRFVRLGGGGRRDTWTVVRGHVQPRPFGSRVNVTIRASLPEVVMIGLGAVFVPIVLVGASIVHGEPLTSMNPYLVFGILIGPFAWCLLCFLHARPAREVEEWLRSAFPAASRP
ncbi:MAG TPA: hypothetical protein VLT58_13420 [Polyangia bacterium]|nr:hypothetical protein [Polyangia bacterium]